MSSDTGASTFLKFPSNIHCGQQTPALCPKHLSQSYPSPHKSLQHIFTSDLGTYLSDSGVHSDYIDNTIYTCFKDILYTQEGLKAA